jgi:hypothetical protein
VRNKTAKPKEKTGVESVQPPSATTTQADILPEEAFLADAEKEPKRILLADHTTTIRTLRDKKRLTFRAIAEWFGERGLETDQSAVYRAYCASLPELDAYGQPIDPRNPIDDEDEAISIDQYQNATLKKKQA